ncbi:DUF262 domain-containing HNH endonuclease family protein [Arthrobacter sp. zg-Y859]|uniref:DUF262 domain-containing HNH endonuclease family protein n=1 Tax=Arthrobacter jinronghuae TaxID=2964609 RepID=A0ABT1NM30_9MICC|nr:DUF262 domain-containing protein [Arthrobacter jinronghuae]MCQ1948770.1 DUF262 domain-containing HNH endonuclease family protein [Arthrobacter jinronghuae]UWX78418.1 DUF262 domain-containing HNH endonuclease family protein [Arthrobacter jinronghuae]
MADPAQFDHDRLGHLLSDILLKVPEFQRRFSWQESHILEYWADIARAKAASNSYFMGTVVLADSPGDDTRKLIIDGQQRITTTAILFIAIRDRLRELGQERAAQSVEDTHLSDYVLREEQTVAKLILSPDDHVTFSILLEGGQVAAKNNLVGTAYVLLKERVDELAPTEEDYRSLIELVAYLDTDVQVLLAVATGLPEAYVIFETLNDRGEDLTTADLLKNFLFSQAGSQGINHAQSTWTRLTAKFDKPEEFVKFLRYEYMSRKGHVTNRGLYKALQSDVRGGTTAVRRYLEGADTALQRYIALREPDDASWSSQAVEVKDSLLAFRRFGFEASMPLLLAAFGTWSHTDATRFVDVVAGWSVRAWIAGTLGGGVAERAFCLAAEAVATGKAATVADVRMYMKDLVPDDATFKQAFVGYGSVTTTRAKYLLARLERQYLSDHGQQTDAMPDWSSKSVTVEHIFAKSSKRDVFASAEEFEKFSVLRDQLQNLTLLERTLNGGLEDKPFDQKVDTYGQSVFALTRLLSENGATWGFDEAEVRSSMLSALAVKAWPK